MRFFLVPLILIGWPLAEIAGFVLVGRALGLWATLGLVIGTAVLGAVLLRSQGMHILRQISTEGREGRMPARTLIDAAMIVVAGILLLLPGFITDIIGLALFIPFVRDLLWSLIGRRIVVVRSPGSTSYRYDGGRPAPEGRKPGPVVDLDEQDFHRNPNSPPPNSSSPWAGPRSGEP
ncbi:FxsA family protein [Neorhizobium petrolearium]|uniref:FxsA family protein n=1 Tax=Neorhizobium petrolearium TaxID=515361 RepID=UPI003F1779A9